MENKNQPSQESIDKSILTILEYNIKNLKGSVTTETLNSDKTLSLRFEFCSETILDVARLFDEENNTK